MLGLPGSSQRDTALFRAIFSLSRLTDAIVATTGAGAYLPARGVLSALALSLSPASVPMPATSPSTASAPAAGARSASRRRGSKAADAAAAKAEVLQQPLYTSFCSYKPKAEWPPPLPPTSVLLSTGGAALDMAKEKLATDKENEARARARLQHLPRW